MSELFLFNTICDDIIGEILQYIKWCKASRPLIIEGKKDHTFAYHYHRLLWIERPIITYSYDYLWTYGKLKSLDLHYKSGRKRAIKKDKKGLISYTYQQLKYKEIAM